ncbi:zinc ribbon domain-containing protein [Nocardioides alcanivorans]|uniref:zinc ribbon domain-containing protein n=1 Tax=Nocardioides alcanivorans TaxID=2897352 RepID=UPI001F1E2566|nr:zinc ribbon domain-containing protein [Nocardioides alcanivorans]
MTQRFCTACGQPVTRKFCTACGTPVRQPGSTQETAAGPTPGGPPPWPQAQPPVPATSGARKRRWWIAATVGLLLVAGAAVTGVVLLGDDEAAPKPNPGAAVEPATSVLGQPGREWSVRAEDVVDEPGATFFAPDFSGEGSR